MTEAEATEWLRDNPVTQEELEGLAKRSKHIDHSPYDEGTKPRRNREVLLMFTLIAVLWACYLHLFMFF